MPYRIATSLLLWQHGVAAFQATPSALPSTMLRLRPPSSLFTAALEIPSLESILDDGHGHINSNLAQAIYEWEVEHNNSINKSFSTRDGLRLVDELARDILSSLTTNDDDGGDDNKDGNGITYNDLVQEGMIALLRAMSTFDNYKKSHSEASSSSTTSSSSSSFEEYARNSIHSSLLHFLAHSSRPIRLPLSLQTTLQSANVAAQKLRTTLGKEPSLVQVAKELKVKPEQLALYRKLYRSMVARDKFVSVEDGMEVYDPSLAGIVGGGGTRLHARSDLDSNTGGKADSNARGSSSTDPTSSTTTSDSNEEQDLIKLNSQEDDWTPSPPERTVSPLKDILTDTEEINNPLSYTHHFLLNEELNSFLLENLTNQELEVIQLRFGLVESKYGGKGWSTTEIADRMGMEREEVVKVASGALDKLRKKAAKTSGEEENEYHDGYVEVSL